eukprot:3941909-Alexandrium_andersonii.AAC.1
MRGPRALKRRPMTPARKTEAKRKGQRPGSRPRLHPAAFLACPHPPAGAGGRMAGMAGVSRR